jgi:hypothetical protein
MHRVSTAAAAMNGRRSAFDARNLEQIRIEWMEEKIKTPQTQGFSFYLISASRRLGVENCFSIHSILICSKPALCRHASAE